MGMKWDLDSCSIIYLWNHNHKHRVNIVWHKFLHKSLLDEIARQLSHCVWSRLEWKTGRVRRCQVKVNLELNYYFSRDRREKKKSITFLSMAKSIALSRGGDQEAMSTSTQEEEDGLLVRDLAWKLDL